MIHYDGLTEGPKSNIKIYFSILAVKDFLF